MVVSSLWCSKFPFPPLNVVSWCFLFFSSSLCKYCFHSFQFFYRLEERSETPGILIRRRCMRWYLRGIGMGLGIKREKERGEEKKRNMEDRGFFNIRKWIIIYIDCYLSPDPEHRSDPLILLISIIVSDPHSSQKGRTNGTLFKLKQETIVPLPSSY